MYASYHLINKSYELVHTKISCFETLGIRKKYGNLIKNITDDSNFKINLEF